MSLEEIQALLDQAARRVPGDWFLHVPQATRVWGKMTPSVHCRPSDQPHDNRGVYTGTDLNEMRAAINRFCEAEERRVADATARKPPVHLLAATLGLEARV